MEKIGISTEASSIYRLDHIRDTIEDYNNRVKSYGMADKFGTFELVAPERMKLFDPMGKLMLPEIQHNIGGGTRTYGIEDGMFKLRMSSNAAISRHNIDRCAEELKETAECTKILAKLTWDDGFMPSPVKTQDVEYMSRDVFQAHAYIQCESLLADESPAKVVIETDERPEHGIGRHIIASVEISDPLSFDQIRGALDGLQREFMTEYECWRIDENCKWLDTSSLGLGTPAMDDLLEAIEEHESLGISNRESEMETEAAL